MISPGGAGGAGGSNIIDYAMAHLHRKQKDYHKPDGCPRCDGMIYKDVDTLRCFMCGREVLINQGRYELRQKIVLTTLKGCPHEDIGISRKARRKRWE